MRGSVMVSRSLMVALVMALAVVGFGRAAMAQDDNAFVRVFHASPDAGPVDIYVDGNLEIGALEYPVATGFVGLPAGTYDIDVVPSGSDLADAVISATLDLAPGLYYSVAAIGPLAALEPGVFVVDPAATDADSARIRIVHNAFDAPPIDVALADGTVLFAGLEYPFETEYIEVQAGVYDLQVLAAGTDTVALDLPGVALDAGIVYDVHAIGLLEQGTLDVAVLTLEVGAAEVTVTEDVTDVAVTDEAVTDDAVAETDGTVGVAVTESGVGGEGLPTTGTGNVAQSQSLAMYLLLAAAIAAASVFGLSLRAGNIRR